MAGLFTGSHFPTSPVWSQPSSSKASAVLSGSFKYPLNTLLPLIQTWEEEEKSNEITGWVELFYLFNPSMHLSTFPFKKNNQSNQK